MIEPVTIQEHILTHNLRRYFPELASYRTTRELQASSIYQRLQSDIEQLMQSFEYRCASASSNTVKPFYRAVAWNIERGICFEEILTLLKTHDLISKADLLLLTETDIGMARSHNRNVARELALALGMNYCFVPCYINLCKGSGVESETIGENDLALHGNAILSRYPIEDPQSITLPNGKDKLRGKEKRIGSQQALAVTINFPQQRLRTVCIHLDALSSQAHRHNQMAQIIRSLQPSFTMPILFAGDWNTTTYNSSSAFQAFFSFWYRVLMGVGHVIANHYPYPERYLEAELFRLLNRYGFDYEKCNELGKGTVHYSVKDLKTNTNLRDWIPQWCFSLVEWSLKPHGGKCSFKLDWFATKDLEVITDQAEYYYQDITATGPKVIGNLAVAGQPLSDHDAIVVDFSL
ncbi:MAG: endonuclease/exonuclease/phosphatase family protein [Acidobacteriota bacterium]